MKVLLLILVILLYQNQCVSCFTIFDLMNSKINDMASFVTNKFHSLAAKITQYFKPKIEHVTERLSYLKFENNKKSRDSFTDFVDLLAADNNTEMPAYLNMKSEPTALMSTTQLVTLHGKRPEAHLIYTSDGYLLTIHRILPLLENTDNSTHSHNKTIVLHHGLLGSSADWILLGAEKSLPYLLCEAGYDVWLVNARGNYYSRGHLKKTVNTEDYWKFSWQEMGEKDLPAVIDYIRSVKNNQDPIDYIGHSLGATALLVMLSTYPSYNEYLRMGILLAPMAYLGFTTGPLKLMTNLSFDPPEPILKIMGTTEFFPSRRIPEWLSIEYCKGPLLICSNPLFFITGSKPNNSTTDPSFLARLLYHVPAGTSTNTILHYAQLVKSGKFHKFNDTSDEYNLGTISLPIAFFSSSDDMLVNVNDVLRLYFSIENPIEHYIISGKNITHSDFVWGENADDIVFSKILEFLTYGLNWMHYKINEVSGDLQN